MLRGNPRLVVRGITGGTTRGVTYFGMLVGGSVPPGSDGDLKACPVAGRAVPAQALPGMSKTIPAAAA